MDCFFQPGQTLQFDHRGTFVIEAVIGRGASCVVYRAMYTDAFSNSTQHLLKEYHPKNISLCRDENGTLRICSEKNQDAFQVGLERFRQGYQQQMKLRQDDGLKNVTSNIEAVYRDCYGTDFIEMTCFEGSSYDKIEETSLADLLLRVKAITEVVSKYHKKGYLHLDIKPSNVFTLPEASNFVILFDFDSVIRKEAITKNSRLSYTDAWAAPEQKQPDAHEKICEATDLYAIGELLFFKLMGRHSSRQEHRVTAVYPFQESPLLKEADESTMSTLTDLFHNTLCVSADMRWQTADALIKALDQLIEAERLSHLQKPPQQQEDGAVQEVGKQLSRLNRNILIAAVLICLSVAILIFSPRMPLFNDASQQNTENENSQTGSTVISDDPESTQDEVDEAAVVLETIPVPETTADGEDIPPISAQEASASYVIDTIAHNLSGFRSLVVDNNGVVYYLDGGIIYNSADSATLDLSSDFDIPLENGYLAYDPYHNILYLLAGGSLSIYDITDFDAPALVLDHTICPDLKFQLAYESGVTPQIVVLEDGSLILPAELDGTYRVIVSANSVTRFSRIYDLASPYYAKVIRGGILKLRGGDLDATWSADGSSENDIRLTIAAPNLNGNSVCATAEGAWFYLDGVGLCRYNTDGACETVIAQADITVRDYQGLDYTNIWSIAVSECGSAAFYDNTLKCIRYISSQ